MILLSAHTDKVSLDAPFSYENGVFKGLLDNQIGVLAIYHALAIDKEIHRLELEGKIKIWHNNSEEWGKLDDTCPKLTKKDIAIAIDVCSSKKYKGYDFTLENISGDFTDAIEGIKWEDFKFLTKKYSGDPSEVDEAVYFKGMCKTLSFIIPIESPNENWHSKHSTLNYDRFNKAVNGLVRLLCYLID